MRASLHKNLLGAMLSRGGWSSGIDVGLERKKRTLFDMSNALVQSEVWILSRHLSRQCALASHWTGNGLDARPAIVESSNIDFIELGNYASYNNRSGGLIFSLSACGRFILVARDTLVYIYELQGGIIFPVTSVLCPRRVLAVSMDASSGRHAMAALLEGRMGLVCELHYGRKANHEDLSEALNGVQEQSTSREEHSNISFSRSHDTAKMDVSEHRLSGVYSSFPYIQERDTEQFNTIAIRSNHHGTQVQDVDDHRSHDRNLINPTWNLNIYGRRQEGTSPDQPCSGHVPIESGTSTFYRNLCSEDDPPRSVAICPQRRCVAFGCSAGIELHWIDALTGQSLSR